VGKRRHAASGRLGRGCPRLRLGPQKARAAPPPASSLQLFRRRRAALRQAAAALHHTRCTCRAACRLRVPVEHAADRRLRGRKITGLPARARHDERRAPPWRVRSRAYHLNGSSRIARLVSKCHVFLMPVLNPLPLPGNGDHPETPLSRLTPNVGENHPYFMPGTPPQHACATLLG